MINKWRFNIDKIFYNQICSRNVAHTIENSILFFTSEIGTIKNVQILFPNIIFFFLTRLFILTYHYKYCNVN